VIGARTSRTPGSQSLLLSEVDNITLEAVKRSEDGAALIVRLVERYNSLRDVTLHFDRPIAAAWTCDLMEREEVELTPQGHRLPITIKPYEIVTLKIEPGDT
jgi:alpha-mannosidase